MENPIYTFATPTIVSSARFFLVRSEIDKGANHSYPRYRVIEKTSTWLHMSYLTAGVATWSPIVAGSICEFAAPAIIWHG